MFIKRVTILLTILMLVRPVGVCLYTLAGRLVTSAQSSSLMNMQVEQQPACPQCSLATNVNNTSKNNNKSQIPPDKGKNHNTKYPPSEQQKHPCCQERSALLADTANDHNSTTGKISIDLFVCEITNYVYNTINSDKGGINHTDRSSSLIPNSQYGILRQSCALII